MSKGEASYIYFLDFDITIMDTTSLFHGLMHDAVRSFGVDDECWMQSEKAIWKGGYTPQKHIVEMGKYCLDKSVLTAAGDALDAALAKITFDKYVYPDVIPFIKRKKEEGVRVCVVSFGNPEWQKFKINGSGIGKLVDDIFITDVPGTKGKIVGEKSHGYEKVIFVDDNLDELDSVKKLAPHVQTYRMLRKSNQVIITSDNLPHIPVSDLNSI